MLQSLRGKRDSLSCDFARMMTNFASFTMWEKFTLSFSRFGGGFSVNSRYSEGCWKPDVRLGCLDSMKISALFSQMSPSMHMMPRTRRFMNVVPMITLTASRWTTRNATQHIDNQSRTRKTTLPIKRSLCPFGSLSGGDRSVWYYTIRHSSLGPSKPIGTIPYNTLLFLSVWKV